MSPWWFGKVTLPGFVECVSWICEPFVSLVIPTFLVQSKVVDCSPAQNTLKLHQRVYHGLLKFMQVKIVYDAYNTEIHRLLDIPLPKDPATINLSSKAEILFRDFESWIEPRLRQFEELDPMLIGPQNWPGLLLES